MQAALESPRVSDHTPSASVDISVQQEHAFCNDQGRSKSESDVADLLFGCSPGAWDGEARSFAERAPTPADPWSKVLGQAVAPTMRLSQRGFQHSRRRKLGCDIYGDPDSDASDTGCNQTSRSSRSVSSFSDGASDKDLDEDDAEVYGDDALFEMTNENVEVQEQCIVAMMKEAGIEDDVSVKGSCMLSGQQCAEHAALMDSLCDDAMAVLTMPVAAPLCGDPTKESFEELDERDSDGLDDDDM